MSNPTNPANPSGGTPGALPEKPHSGPSKGLIIGIVVIVLAIIVGLVVFFATRKPKAAATTTVTIGVTDESQPYWAKLKELAAKENITVQTKNFASYTEVNPALRQKQLDLNQFQHLLYLANYNVQNNDNIVPLGGSMIVPLGLYSKKHTSVDQIPQGGEIAIPNDPTNEARALLVLQAAGLLKLNGGGTALSTPADIDQANRSRILSLSEGGRAEFVVKNLNHEALCQLEENLRRSILQLSMTPDLSDQNFAGNASGVALQYKLWGIEQVRSAKEQAFTDGILALLKALAGGLATLGRPVTFRAKPTFYKNLPQDAAALSETLLSLSPLLSRRTILERLPYVDDPVEEERRKEREESNLKE